MEQVSSLTMNPNSGPSTPRLEPSTPIADKKAGGEVEKEADTSSLASTSTITPDTPTKDDSAAKEKDIADGGAPKIETQTARERAFQHGLDKNNFETEVHQVMGTLNSWWGGVKKQVSGDLDSHSRTVTDMCSLRQRYGVSRRMSTRPSRKHRRTSNCSRQPISK